MASMKDIKNRIRSVESTMQITKAMELVASSKMRKAKLHAERTRPYFTTLYATGHWWILPRAIPSFPPLMSAPGR